MSVNVVYYIIYQHKSDIVVHFDLLLLSEEKILFLNTAGSSFIPTL